MKTVKNRVESDLLGSRELPETSYTGIHTLRALQNFPFGGDRVNPGLLHALGDVKYACAEANGMLGFIPVETAKAIMKACDELSQGLFDSDCQLSALQGGAGTSTNMMVNEIIANRALEILEFPKGMYSHIHPIETVNLHQSTNDVYPSALKIAVIRGLRALSDVVAGLQGAFQAKEKEFSPYIMMGRTELQEAVPMTMGSQFATFAEAIGRDRWRVFKAEERIRMVTIGGTAIGTGLTAPKAYIFLVIERLRARTGLGIARAENCVEATANGDAFVEVAAMLRAHQKNLLKICRDLRFLHYQQELELPAVQAGSSIMPGKINPVILEAVMGASIRAGAELGVVEECSGLGTLQIQEFLPLTAHSLLTVLELFITAGKLLAQHISGIRIGEKACSDRVENSPAIITAFLPYVGYKAAESMVKEYMEGEKARSFRSFLEEKLGEELVEKVLSPQQLMALGHQEKLHENT